MRRNRRPQPSLLWPPLLLLPWLAAGCGATTYGAADPILAPDRRPPTVRKPRPSDFEPSEGSAPPDAASGPCRRARVRDMLAAGRYRTAEEFKLWAAARCRTTRPLDVIRKPDAPHIFYRCSTRAIRSCERGFLYVQSGCVPQHLEEFYEAGAKGCAGREVDATFFAPAFPRFAFRCQGDGVLPRFLECANTDDVVDPVLMNCVESRIAGAWTAAHAFCRANTTARYFDYFNDYGELFRCRDGTAHRQVCPDGQLWDTVWEVCHPRERVHRNPEARAFCASRSKKKKYYVSVDYPRVYCQCRDSRHFCYQCPEGTERFDVREQKCVGGPRVHTIKECSSSRSADSAVITDDVPLYVWTKFNLTYSIPKSGGGLTLPQMREVIRRALDEYQAYTPLRFHETFGDTADLRFVFGPLSERIHARATFPPGGTVVYNEEFKFSYSAPRLFPESIDRNAADFFTLTLHEVGHAIGMHHMREPHSIMYPCSTIGMPGLSSVDRRRLAELYGEKSAVRVAMKRCAERRVGLATGVNVGFKCDEKLATIEHKLCVNGYTFQLNHCVKLEHVDSFWRAHAACQQDLGAKVVNTADPVLFYQCNQWATPVMMKCNEGVFDETSGECGRTAPAPLATTSAPQAQNRHLENAGRTMPVTQRQRPPSPAADSTSDTEYGSGDSAGSGFGSPRTRYGYGARGGARRVRRRRRLAKRTPPQPSPQWRASQTPATYRNAATDTANYGYGVGNYYGGVATPTHQHRGGEWYHYY